MTDRKAQILSFLDADPQSSFLLFALAKEYENENKHTEAISIYEKLLAFNGEYTGAYYHLGKQYIAINNINAAHHIFTQGIEICKKLNAQHDASELRSALDDIEE